MINRLTKFFISAATGVVFSLANAADISVTTSTEFGMPVINVIGAIDSSDGDKFSILAYRQPNALVSFDGPGGSLLAGIQIGTIIRMKGFSTAVRGGNSCASACAYAWLAGHQRYADGNSSIGFHAAYTVNQGVAKESGVGNALLGSYLARIGLSDESIIYFTSSPPEGIAWLKGSAAAKLGLKVQDLSVLRNKSDFSNSSSGGSTAATSSSKLLESASVAFLRQYFSYWSTDGDQAIRFLENTFNDEVNFYGKVTPKGAIIKEKMTTIRRWPARVYIERPSSIQVTCNTTSKTCEINGLIDWEVRSEARNAAGGGVSQFQFSLNFNSGMPKVTAESGFVLERKK